MQETLLTRNVVLVEDDHDACIILEHILKKAGYNVNSMYDGLQILEKGFSAPDVFIFDVSIPHIDGVALCKFTKLCMEMHDVPVIVLSGNHQAKKKAIQAGARCFLEKPFMIELLMEIENAINAKSLSYEKR
jgi:DNA-binding response OmpR family regulator